VQGIVLEVCDAIISKMKNECIPCPKKEDWVKISNDFWEIWNFPNCIGALDGKHVAIEATRIVVHYSLITRKHFLLFY